MAIMYTPDGVPVNVDMYQVGIVKEAGYTGDKPVPKPEPAPEPAPEPKVVEEVLAVEEKETAPRRRKIT